LHEISAGQLADETGIPIRQIQFWTDATVLHALPESDRQGRGRHRVYLAAPPWHGERTFCLIAAELNRMSLPVGAMKRVNDFFRANIGPTEKPPRGGWKLAMSNNSIGRALLGELSVVIIRPGGGASSVVKFEPSAKLPRRKATWTVQELTAAGIPSTAAVAIYEGVTAEIPGSFMVEESSGYCLNLTRILAPLADVS
jgi:hypothetical protein